MKNNPTLLNVLYKTFSIFDAKERQQLIVHGFFAVALAMLEAIAAGLVMPYVALLSGTNQLGPVTRFPGVIEIVKAYDERQLLLVLSLILIIFFVFKSVFAYCFIKNQYKFLYSKMSETSLNVFKYYLNLPLEKRSDINGSTVVSSVTSDVNNFFINFLVPMLTGISEVLVGFAVVFTLILVATVPALFILMVGLCVSFYAYRKMRRRVESFGKIAQAENTERIKWVNQAANMHREIWVGNLQGYFLKNYQFHEERFAESSKQSMTLNQTPRLFVEGLSFSLLALCVIFSVIKSSAVDKSVLPVLSLFGVAAVRLMPSINRVVQSVTRMMYYRQVAQSVIDKIVDAKLYLNMPKLIANPKNLPDDWTELCVKDISFSYGNTVILSKINFKIRRNSIIALTGESGGGKTTLVDIICGLLVPTSGAVLVDGVSIKNNLSDWRARFAYVPQNIYLIDASIYDNIVLDARDRMNSDEDVWEALELAQMRDYVESLPGRLEYRIGDNGCKLSGGQKQRLAIARAMFKRPQVLVLDEATSALDNKTEAEIGNTLIGLSKYCTIIMIAHRAKAISIASAVYEIGNSKLKV